MRPIQTRFRCGSGPEVLNLASKINPEPTAGPVSYRFTYTGMEVRVLDYGQSAFVTRIRINGADRVIKDEVKIGSPREQIEAMLGRPVRGGGSYAVYEGKSDVVRVYYTPDGKIASVEVQHDS